MPTALLWLCFTVAAVPGVCFIFTLNTKTLPGMSIYPTNAASTQSSSTPRRRTDYVGQRSNNRQTAVAKLLPW